MFLNISGTLADVFKLGKSSSQVAIRTNSGVLQGMNNGGSWENILGQGGGAYTISSVSTNYNVQTSDQVILCTSGSGGITLTLPTASSMSGKQLIIKKVDSGVGSLVVDGNTSETIDGSLTQTLTSQYSFIIIVSDGSNWHIIGGTLWA